MRRFRQQSINVIASLIISLLLSCGGGSGGGGGDNSGSITTTNHTPSAVAGTPVINGLYVTFDAFGSSDPDGDSLTFNWDFGDGYTGNGRICTHTYNAPGNYTVAVTVSDGLLSDIAVQTITVVQSTVAFPQPFDVDALYVEDIYVALPPTGSDSSGNGSLVAPFATIRHALSQAASGSRIRVQAGTYGAIGSVADVHGTETYPILITTDGQVVVDAGGSGSGMQISNVSYLVIEGLIFQNTGIHGLNIDDGGDYSTPTHHVVFRNVSFRNIGSGGNNDCLKMSGVDDFYITGSEFQECDRGEAIDMVGCHDGVITGNFFHDVVQNGVQTKGGSADVLIHGNRFEDIPQRAINAGGSTGSPYFRPLNAEYEAARIQMVGNTFLRTGSTPVAFVGCDACVFANNTIIEPLSYVARILEENTSRTAGHDGYFINNLLVFDTADINSWSYVNVGPNTRPDTFIFGWNLWYALDDPSFSGPVYQGGLPAESNAVIQQDPLLYNLVGGDYHIMHGSPAQGAGRSVPRGAVADFDYTPFNDPSSIGAYEVQ